jgi:hypothetical protein
VVEGVRNYTLSFIGPIYSSYLVAYKDALWDTSVAAQRAVNEMLHGFEPWEICLISVAISLTLFFLQRRLAYTIQNIKEDGGFLPAFFSAIRCLPLVQSTVKKEKNKLRTSLLEARSSTARKAQSGADDQHINFHTLPSQGLPTREVSELLLTKAKEDLQLSEGKSPL